ncbi:MAG: NAD(P)H-hydrate epimerase [Elusimicrobiota bacterium]
MKALTSEQMRALDRRSETEFGVTSLQLMENAGRAIANAVIKILCEKLSRPLGEALVVVCCGRGNNGGDGLAAAINLKKSGVPVEVYCVPLPENKPMKPEYEAQVKEAKKNGIIPKFVNNPEIMSESLVQTALIVDALLGTGSKGKPMGPAHKIIQKIMKAKKPILALDIPSGIDADTGYHSGVYIQANWTVTLGAAKTGLLKPYAQQYIGELIVTDIGHPKKLLEEYLK